MALDEECESAGLDPKQVEGVARNLSKWAREANRLGLTIFGGAGNGSLRANDQLIVAELDGHNWDGGDGACGEGKDGLMRGEIERY